MAKGKASTKKGEAVSVDDKILAQYMANNPGAKVQELDTEGNPIGDEQTLSNFLDDIDRAEPPTTTPISDAVTNVTTRLSSDGSSDASDTTTTQGTDSDTNGGGNQGGGTSRPPLITPGAGAQTALNTVSGFTQRASDWIASQPTPGGIAAVLVAIMFVLWVMVPTSTGQTRMYLLWLTLTGRTKLKGAKVPVNPDGSTDYGGGAIPSTSGTFGGSDFNGGTSTPSTSGNGTNFDSSTVTSSPVTSTAFTGLVPFDTSTDTGGSF